MVYEGNPCKDGLTKECFKKYPKWAKRVFAYRIMHILLGKEGTRALQRLLSLPLTPENLETIESAKTILDIVSEPVIGEGSTISPGVELPEGAVIPPDSEVTQATLEEAISSGNYTVNPEPITVDPDTGATAPIYTDIFIPGPQRDPGLSEEPEKPFGHDDYVE